MKAQLTPYVLSEDARTQAETYIQALGGEVVSVMTFGQLPGTPDALKDRVMHMAITVAGGNALFLTDAAAPAAGNRAIALALSFADEADARQAFARLGEGGSIKFPFEPQPWGANYGEIEDRFGVTWQIVQQ
ncbi:VOC family protein [Paenibacillus cymbidii]|uniref:VOC family protein n=1 Tax=Paenibacillus cymbidii TaxID=1639034 RepID=UPI0010818366|nr:VOC family protein [Paenibacillus cymbidii]